MHKTKLEGDVKLAAILCWAATWPEGALGPPLRWACAACGNRYQERFLCGGCRWALRSLPAGFAGVTQLLSVGGSLGWTKSTSL
jgi:hypothetical protein